jgi:hypothetical protein
MTGRVMVVVVKSPFHSLSESEGPSLKRGWTVGLKSPPKSAHHHPKGPLAENGKDARLFKTSSSTGISRSENLFILFQLDKRCYLC